MAPPTAAMGPTSHSLPARSMVATGSGSPPATGRGASEVPKWGSRPIRSFTALLARRSSLQAVSVQSNPAAISRSLLPFLTRKRRSVPALVHVL
ncbi:MAG: hypothetical protein R6U36_02435 [Candidatus Fermentibacteraceae bacterium]